jgi:hypothetical protein
MKNEFGDVLQIQKNGIDVYNHPKILKPWT